MRPSLIPHTFITKHIRKQYHKKRGERTWIQFCNVYNSYLWLLAGIVFLLCILYIKYIEKKKKQNDDIHTYVPETQQNGFLYYS